MKEKRTKNLTHNLLKKIDKPHIIFYKTRQKLILFTIKIYYQETLLS
jgi:hypothetical protein